MRTVGALLAIFALGVPASALGQSDPPPPPVSAPAPAPAAPDVEAPVWKTHTLTLQPLPWPFGSYGGAVEFALRENFSFALGFNLTALTFMVGSSSSNATSTNSSSTSVSPIGVHLEPGIHYYLAGRAPSGLWIGPKLEIGYISVTSTSSFSFSGTGIPPTTNSSTSTVGGLMYGVHAMVGYNYVAENGLTIQAGLGIGLASTSLNSSFSSGGSTTSSTQPVFLTGSFGRASFGLGWTF